MDNLTNQIIDILSYSLNELEIRDKDAFCKCAIHLLETFDAKNNTYFYGVDEGEAKFRMALLNLRTKYQEQQKK